VQPFGFHFRARFIPILQTLAQRLELELEIAHRALAQNVSAIPQQLLRMPNQEMAVLNVFLGQHSRKVAAPPALQNRIVWQELRSRQRSSGLNVSFGWLSFDDAWFNRRWMRWDYTAAYQR
jgi:hypothetical protein